MKKLLVLALVVFGLAACQTEPQFDVQMGGEQEVMLTVSLPEATRASSADGFDLANIADTKYTLRYILEVYRVVNATTNELTTTCQRFVKTSDAPTMVFPVRLAPGYQYQVVAWADIVLKNGAVLENGEKADRYYDTDSEDGLKAVSIVDGTWNAMDETRDAYTATQAISTDDLVNGVELKLTRPFAKLRVVATDIDAIRKVGLEPTTATVVYAQDMYRSFNAVTGKASSEEAKSHTIEYPAPYTDATGEYTLFADYIFVPADGTAQFSLNVYADADQLMLIKGNNFNTEISVERNKLTTIKGDVLTVGGNVEVKVENGLGQLETINYADNAETLQEIINKAPAGEQTNITLGGNIDLGNLLSTGILSTRASEPTYGLLIPAGTKVVLDLNGHTISQTKECASVYSMIVNKGTLTITDSSENGTGKISFQDTGAGDPAFGWGSYTLTNEGTLVIENGTIENTTSLNTNNDVIHMYCAIQQANGSTTIKGGNISNNTYRSIRVNRGTLTIEGGNFNGQIWMQPFAENSSIVISGGKFQPSGPDGSSIFVTNDEKHVALTVTGGEFMTKIGCSDATKLEGVITGGTFTTAAKEGTKAALINDDYTWAEGENDLWTLVEKQKNNEIWYESDEMKLEPTNPDALNATVVSTVWDKTTGKGVITFDRDLTTIGEKAFQRLTNTTPSNWITSITLPESVTTIGDYAFAQCYSLTTINIPDSVISIGQYAFQSCDAVTTVTIGSGVKSIGSSAFYNCYEIKEIICKSYEAPALADKYVFNGVDKAAKVYVPAASVNTYKAANIWSNFTNIVGK